jgi:acylglycerol lipase
LVLTAASIDVKWNAILRAQAAMGALLAKSAPRARLVPAVRLEDMSDDAATLDAYATDPYVQLGPVRCRTAYEILRGFRALRARYRELSCPLLVLHGSEDACADKTASRRLVLEASSMDKQYVELPGMHHLILQEPGSKDVLNRIVDFVDSRAAARPSASRVVGVVGGARSALPSKL